MDHAYLLHILRMILASAICTAMLGSGLLYRRKNGSRRWILFVAGILGAVLTIATIIANEGGIYEPGRFDGAGTLSEVTIGLILLPIAIVLIVRARKGKRVGDHPYCRRCGFDLFGKPADTTRCGECGNDLTAPKATVIGVRQIRRRLAMVGIFLLILGAMWSTQPFWQFARQYDFNRLKPTNWLIDELNSKLTYDQAAKVLVDRLIHGNLSHAQVQKIADHTLKNLEAGVSDEMLYPLLATMDVKNDFNEQTTRRLMKQGGFLDTNGPWTSPQIVQGQPFFVHSHFDLVPMGSNPTKNIWTLQRFKVGMHSPVFRIGESIFSEKDSHCEAADETGESYFRMKVDFGSAWSQVPSGRIAIALDFILIIRFDDDGKVLEERVPLRRFMRTTVLTQEQAEKCIMQPTPDDQSAVWSATIYDGPPKKNIVLKQSWPKATPIYPAKCSRIFAKVIVVDGDRRKEIGTVATEQFSGGGDMGLGTGMGMGGMGSVPTTQPDLLYTVQLLDSIPIPAGDFLLELVPAPVEAAIGWDDAPIVNQVVRISDIKRSNGTPPTN